MSDDARYRLWFQLLRAEFAKRGEGWAAYGQHISSDEPAWRQNFDDGLSAEEACDAEIDAAQGN